MVIYPSLDPGRGTQQLLEYDLTKTNFLFKVFLFLFSWQSGCLLAYRTPHISKVPNILFAFADDWGRQASAYAKTDGPGTINDVALTPNFDKLAQSGVLFTNASVNAPSCTPCRSSILSGRTSWETGRGAHPAGCNLGHQHSNMAAFA